ncbi:MAG TPA: hypothetical protein VGD78_08235 [Chthoniobacterales bacterium]
MRKILWVGCILFGWATAVTAQDIHVHSAFYGDGRYGVDVTAQVQELADQGMPFNVTNETFGRDPLPGRRKFLTVNYLVHGERFSQRTEEYHVFRFEVPSVSGGPVFRERGGGDEREDGFGPGFDQRPEGARRIVQALYGARHRHVDVTDAVRHLAREGVRFKVSNETFGVDPAKGTAKKLRVIYEEQGGTFEKTYDEGDRVRLR